MTKVQNDSKVPNEYSTSRLLDPTFARVLTKRLSQATGLIHIKQLIKHTVCNTIQINTKCFNMTQFKA